LISIENNRVRYKLSGGEGSSHIPSVGSDVIYRENLRRWMLDFGRDWRWAITLTFVDQYISQELADKKVYEFVHRINRRLYGKYCEKYVKKPQISALVVRELTSNGAIHYHLAIEKLMNSRPSVNHLVKSALRLQRFLHFEWMELGGGEQFRMEPIFNKSGWIEYMFKKVKQDCSFNPDPVIYDYLRKFINTAT